MKYLSSIISDKINKYYDTGKITCTNFLDPGEIAEISNMLNKINYSIYGGYENAERKIIFIGADDNVDYENCISVIRVTSNDKLTHRNVLGSVLGLGIKREMIGDILVNDCICDIIISNTIRDFIINNLKYVGKERVDVNEIKFNEITTVSDLSKEIKTTVKSLRVDSVISAGFGISREKSSELVKNEMVKLNYISVKSATKILNEGDIISVRGKGRIVLFKVLDKTRSDRIKIILLKK